MNDLELILENLTSKLQEITAAYGEQLGNNIQINIVEFIIKPQSKSDKLGNIIPCAADQNSEQTFYKKCGYNEQGQYVCYPD